MDSKKAVFGSRNSLCPHLISVGIPVFNSASFLCCCLDSVLNQSYSNLEILLVYDDSKDDTLSICNAYASRDSRIRIIHNSFSPGIANARNTILHFFSGDFLFFVDSDDYLFPDAISLCYCVRKQYLLDDAGISGISYHFLSENGKLYNPGESKTKIFKTEEAVYSVLSGDFSSVVWGKLFPRSVFSNISFDPSTGGNEDNNTMFLVYSNCSRFVLLASREYVFRNNPTSLTHKSDHYFIAAKTNETMLLFAKKKSPKAVPFLEWRVSYFFVNDAAEKYEIDKNYSIFLGVLKKHRKVIRRSLFSVFFKFHTTWREKNGSLLLCVSGRLFLKFREKGLIA